MGRTGCGGRAGGRPRARLLILLDEQLPSRALSRARRSHRTATVVGWFEERRAAWQSRGRQDSRFLSRETGALGIVVLAAMSNALEDLLPLVTDAQLAIERIQPGRV